jgi:ABC-type lipoprotein export system ATPase subunit
MKIKSVHLRSVGPLSDYKIEFTDDWKGGLHDLILFSGVNGSGKSTILRTIAHLWALTGKWLSTPGKLVPLKTWSRSWFSERHASAAVLFEGAPAVEQLGLYVGEPKFLEELRNKYPDVKWIGETYSLPSGPGRPPRKLLHENGQWLSILAEQYRKLILNGGESMPNIIHLDGEERRWVAPRQGLGAVVADDPQLKWLVGYRASWDWQGQLEASLIAQKTLNEKRYLSIIHDLNRFLAPKQIDPQPTADTLRLRVKCPRGAGGRTHTLDDLSSGEHQILIQFYLISRWLNPGGIVLLDEPDLHLHPSLLSLFLSQLEEVVRSRGGQLILTSHNPELWRRYENKGLRIQLGGEL